LHSKTSSKNTKNILEKLIDKKTNKRSLKDILSLYWKTNKVVKKPEKKEKVFFKEVKNKMKEATYSYKSIMDVHGVLVEAYKKILEKSVSKKQ
jgi:flagellar hook-basal body complex protein FliE